MPGPGLRRGHPGITEWRALAATGEGGARGDLAEHFLSPYHPPPLPTTFSQRVGGGREPPLACNHELDPALCEGVTLRSDGGNRTIAAMSDCMWRALDGIDEAGPRPSPALRAEVPPE